MPGTSFVVSSGVITAMNTSHTDYCSGVLSAFCNESSTIEQKQQYAECVGYIYPKEEKHDSFGLVMGLCILGCCVWTAWFIWGMEKIEYGYAQFAWQIAPAVLCAIGMMIFL